MKLTKSCKRAGAILLGLLVLVIAILIIGYAAYRIIKRLSNWNPRPINPDDVALWIQSTTAEMATNSSSVLSDGTEVTRLEQLTRVVKIERSTNLVDWEIIHVLHDVNVQLIDPIALDTNRPYPQAFYRVAP